ncbi:phage virion morphogenesis protein [Geobacter pelophilus]|uniref:Phage virion morphogenesis protein n=1 Tax=Geoanaerobacter pelophilus TaxID=60036 RepID=A0AAW4L879_9BACT|nr:phage virion morphogenesis protein [Geoanaerobacter pelophilus]MBT0665757.1 phage virion morphogenesis protein [Geoanaerobacter pelophilus]
MAAISKVELQGTAALRQRLHTMITRGADPQPLLRQIAGIMDDEVQQNFEAGGRDPKWPESKRVKKSGGQTLIKSAQLVNSIQQFVTANAAGLSTNKEYAAIHNFGGEIKRGPHYSTVRLRTDARGNLLRQSTEGLKANLAVFAKASHKRTVTRFRFNNGYTINMPQREYFKISPTGLENIKWAAVQFVFGP